MRSPAVHSRCDTAGRGVPVTAFGFSGGASLAAAQVEMLQALYEHGIEPDFLVGTSAGSLNAAFVASRPQTSETATQLGRVWSDLRREDVFPVSTTTLVGSVTGRRDHLVPHRGLRQLLNRYLEFDDLAGAPIPLHLVAFDLIEGREVRSDPRGDSQLRSRERHRLLRVTSLSRFMRARSKRNSTDNPNRREE